MEGLKLLMLTAVFFWVILQFNMEWEADTSSHDRDGNAQESKEGAMSKADAVRGR